MRDRGRRSHGMGTRDPLGTQQMPLWQHLAASHPLLLRILPLPYFPIALVLYDFGSPPEDNPTIGPAVPERLQNVAPTQHVPIQPPTRPPIITVVPGAGQTISAPPTGPTPGATMGAPRPGMPMPGMHMPGMPMPGMPGMPGMHMGMHIPGMPPGFHGMPGMPMMMPRILK